VRIEFEDVMKAAVDDFMTMPNDNFHQNAPAYVEGSLFHSSTDIKIKNRVMDDIKKF